MPSFNTISLPREIVSVVNALPGCLLILLPDAPCFTIAGATDSYLECTHLEREDALGKPLFETLAGNPGNPHVSGVKNLLSSLEYVLAQKEQHQVEKQRYDIWNPFEQCFETHVWRLLNKPVLDEAGAVQYIIHCVEDTAEAVQKEQPKQEREAMERSRQSTDESQKELLAFFEQSPVAIAVIAGENLTFRIANKLFGVFANRKPEELIGKPLLESLPELAGQGFDTLLNKVIETGEPYLSPEVSVLIRRGQKLETIFVNLACQPTRDNNGSISGVFVIATDVTFQVLARQMVMESEAQFRAMADGIDVLIASSNENSEANYFNQAWIKLTGKPMEELLGFGWAEVIHPEDKEHNTSTYLNAVKLKKRYTGEFSVLNSSGDYCWIFATALPRFTAEGSFASYICSGIDITDLVQARKQTEESERALRTFILQAPVAIAILRSRDYVVEIGNKHALEFWGRSSEEVMNRPLFDCLPELRAQGFREFFDDIFDSGVPVSLTEHPIEFKRAGKQDQFYFNFLYQVLHGADGQVNGLMAVGVDMTLQTKARLKIEEAVAERTRELAHANKQLQQSNAELNQFTHLASHDLSEPLRKISTYTGMLASAFPDMPPKAGEYLHRIENCTKRMQNLIHDVLDFSTIAQPTEKFEKVDLNGSLKGVLEDYELLMEQTGAVITTGAFPVIDANALQMNQLFTNLISNALKFRNLERMPAISIISRQLSQSEVSRYGELLVDQVYHSIVCTDNGIGFDQQYAEKIFVIFQQLHRRSEYEGTGIGLAMCKKIVRNHNGLMFASAQVDKGASFTIILPEIQHEVPEWHKLVPSPS